MLHKIWNEMKNPFILFGYESPDNFCDRQRETERLLNAAENGRNLVLASVRRLGKSVLIRHVQYKMRIQKEIIPIYLDIMPTTDLSSFTKIFAKSVFEQSATLSVKSLSSIKSLLTRITPSITVDAMTNQPSLELKFRDNEDAVATIEDTFRFLNARKERFYICIDEFQQITSYTEKNLEAILRSHIQQMNNVSFVFSGSKKHLLTAMFNDVGRPFFLSTEFLELNKIERDSYSEFILKKFTHGKQNISSDSVAEILVATRTHTYYVQFLCNRLFEQQIRKIQSKDIIRTIQLIINENEAIYQSFRNFLTNNQWSLLKAISKEGAIKEPTSAEFIKTNQLGSSSSVSQALKSLIEKELVFTENGQYVVADVFFSLWLRNL